MSSDSNCKPQFQATQCHLQHIASIAGVLIIPTRMVISHAQASIPCCKIFYTASLWRSSIDASSLLYNLQDAGVISQLLRYVSHKLQVLGIVRYPRDQRQPDVFGLPPLHNGVG